MTEIIAREANPSEYPLWNQIAEEDPAATIYQDTRWLQAVSTAAGDELVLLGFHENGKLVAGMPFQVRRRAGFTIARRAFATPYSGLIRARGISPAAGLTKAINAAAAKYSRFSMCLSPFATPPALDSRWQSLQRATSIICLNDEQAMWEALGAPLQKKIRRTARRGMRVETLDDPGVFYNLYLATFSRRGLRPPFEPKAFSRFISAVTQNGIGRVYVAVSENRPCAARLVLYDSRRAYCALSGFDPALASLRAADLLMWEVIKTTAKTHKELDLVGANIAGISEFKRKFRPSPRPYLEAIHWKNGFHRLAVGLHQWATQSRRGSGHG